ncbi:MAG: hypothetical protein J5842_04795, partial [Lachnospiraceae bacterium]|nr:hypothetical protein [Lachnospiraceae bacterium]
TTYEAVLPNPVSTFAINSLQDATGGENSSAVLVDNEARFKMRSLLARFSDMSLLLMNKSAVVFPFWENRTRALEWRVFLLLICRIFASTVILVSVIFGLVSWMRNKGAGLWKMFKSKLRDKISRMLWERPVKKKVKIEDEEF